MVLAFSLWMAHPRPRHVSWTKIALGFLLAGCLLPASAFAQLPPFTGRVVDPASVLTPTQSAELARSLEAYERDTTHQIAVLVTPSLDGESIEVYSLRIAKAWALGRRHVDNGMLVVLAPNERQVRIQLGRGFEPFISNERAAVIVQQHMLPHLKGGRYAMGLQEGLDALMKDGRALVAPPLP